MATILEKFPYPPLPVGVDALRILSVEPGDFSDPVVGTLTSVAFSSKPRYVALSYTWGDPYPDNATLPISSNEPSSSPHNPSESTSANPRSQTSISSEPRVSASQAARETIPTRFGAPSKSRESTQKAMITMNGSPFPVHHNLYLALLHLRSSTLALPLWVDAICINQVNLSERNAQVAMMSFIYTRAEKVVAWLGVKEYRNKLSVFQGMASDWKAGQVRHFASSVAMQAGKTKFHYSLEPDQSTFARIADSSYWTRLWVVQEVCLPRLLVFVYGSKIWRCESLQRWEALKAARSGRPKNFNDVGNDGLDAMLGLLDMRDARHTDAMMLENLAEVFAKHGCGELRDRVYGLLGLALDSCSLSTVDGNADSVDASIESLDLAQLESLRESDTSRGSFRIDYSRSFYDIWADLVKFVFFRAKSMPGRFINSQGPNMAIPEAFSGGASSLLNDERKISIVRAAGIAQDALGHMVEEEETSLDPPEESAQFPFLCRLLKAKEANKTKHINERPITIRAIGYLSGEIVHLGPAYSSLVGSFRAQQEWLSCWGKYYQKSGDLETLRRIYEEYMAKIMDYEDKDLARIRELRSPSTVAWRVAGGRRPENSDPSHAAQFDEMWDNMHNNEESSKSKGPRICLGTDHLMTVVPAAAKVGDVVVRFWNCDAAILMRPVNLHTGVTGTSVSIDMNTLFTLVGRADVAELTDRKATPGHDVRAEDVFSAPFSTTPTPGLEKDRRAGGAVYVELDLRTLQIVTASIST
jgi:hypothetical protein